jgi:hypothetical protein
MPIVSLPVDMVYDVVICVSFMMCISCKNMPVLLDMTHDGLSSVYKPRKDVNLSVGPEMPWAPLSLSFYKIEGRYLDKFIRNSNCPITRDTGLTEDEYEPLLLSYWYSGPQPYHYPVRNHN